MGIAVAARLAPVFVRRTRDAPPRGHCEVWGESWAALCAPALMTRVGAEYQGGLRFCQSRRLQLIQRHADRDLTVHRMDHDLRPLLALHFGENAHLVDPTAFDHADLLAEL